MRSGGAAREFIERRILYSIAYSYLLTDQPIQPVQPIQPASLVSSARGESVSCKQVSPAKNLKYGAL